MILSLNIFDDVFFSTTFLVAINLYFVPQIVSNVIYGASGDFDFKSIVLALSLRPLLPLYIKGYPDNLYQISSSTFFVIGVIALVLFQILILYFQAKRGARFFIPEGLLSKLSKDLGYFKDLSGESEGTELIKLVRTCNICMGQLSKEPRGVETAHPEAIKILKKRNMTAGKVMRTECGHKFHAICLIESMMSKMECPMCGEDIKEL